MKRISCYRAFIINLAIALIPIAGLLSPAIRNYVFDYYSVSAVYNSIIITLYILGSCCALSSSWCAASNDSILTFENAEKKSQLLLNMNKVLFSKNKTDVDAGLLNDLADEVVKKRAQSMSFIMSCSNIATLIGLLGTFAGLSLTIGSIGTLLGETTSSGDAGSANTLSMIVGMISSLTEPLKGMNTAFISSIYGVVCAILLTTQNIVVRGSFSKVLDGLTKIRLHNAVKSKGKSRSVRIESQNVAEIKELFINFIAECKNAETSRNEHAISNATLLKESNELLGNVLNCNNEKLTELSESIIFSNQKILERTGGIHNSLCLMQQNNEEYRTNKIAKIDKIESDLNSGIKLLSENDQKIISQSKNINAEMMSYKDSFIPLLGKITSMYQSLSKNSIKNEGKSDEQ
ncbi:MotA/TolQ/ExbB proton channel family protein [Yersinia mollaretii]|uniref:MotA/TolQ/ExbB proton channel family protein n=1 Tax=Yersinia mollaretii TaxID=33060 RepID=UPI0011A24ABB|nr:MotA/TolQ/ExbB proton channel family protein [Yersinia mollaretii]